MYNYILKLLVFIQVLQGGDVYEVERAITKQINEVCCKATTDRLYFIMLSMQSNIIKQQLFS